LSAGPLDKGVCSQLLSPFRGKNRNASGATEVDLTVGPPGGQLGGPVEHDSVTGIWHAGFFGIFASLQIDQSSGADIAAEANLLVGAGRGFLNLRRKW
jgi:hypothetical protein